MQTFVPVPDLSECAMILDLKRLQKQRVECKQILRALRGETRGWRNHPATVMWRGHEGFLVQYAIACCRSWEACGYTDNLKPYFVALSRKYSDITPPYWWGDDRVHRSHRSNLIRKAPDYYRKFWPEERSDLDYRWPSDPTRLAPVS